MAQAFKKGDRVRWTDLPELKIDLRGWVDQVKDGTVYVKWDKAGEFESHIQPMSPDYIEKV